MSDISSTKSSYESLEDERAQLIDLSDLLPDGLSVKKHNKRWGILSIICLIMFMEIFNVGIFGYINDVVSEYFHKDPGVVDLLSDFYHITRGLFGFALGIVAEHINLRLLSMMGFVTAFTGAIMVSTGIFSRSNFAMVAIGQMLNGMGAAISIPSTQMMSNNWFPENERATATSFVWVSRTSARLVSNIVATQTFQYTQSDNFNSSKPITITVDETLMTVFRTTFLCIYFTIASVALIFFAWTQFYVTDYPPGHVESTTSTNTSSFDPLKDFKKTWEVIKEPTFMLMFVEYILFLGGAPFICILSSSVVLQSFPEKTDKSLSMMLCVAYSAGWVTVIIAGRVLDRIKRKHNVLIVSIIVSVFGDALCSYGLYFHNYYYVFAGYVINSSFRDVMYLCVVHANVCKMARDEPVARIRVFLLLTLTRAVTPLHALFVRFILNYAGAPVSVLYPVLLEISLGILHVNRQE